MKKKKNRERGNKAQILFPYEHKTYHRSYNKSI